MKILHMTDYYMPGFGYQDNNIIPRQKLLGHEAIIITSDRYWPIPEYEKTWGHILGARIQSEGIFYDKGIKIVRLKTIFENKKHCYTALKGLRKAIIEFGPDIIHLHDIIGFLQLQTLFTAKKYGINIFIDSHICHFNVTQNSKRRKLFYLTYGFLLKSLFLNRVKKILPINNDALMFLWHYLKIPASLMEVNVLGVDTSVFKLDEQIRKSTRQRLGFSDQDLVFIHTGKFSFKKKTIEIVKTVTNLSHFNIKLLLIGDGALSVEKELKDILKTDRNNSVTRMSHVAQKELAEYFNAADIAVWIGEQTNSIQQAMACGNSVILRRDLVSAEIIESGGGWMINEGDDTAIENIISEIRNNPEILQTKKNEALEIIRSKYDGDIITKNLMDIYIKNIGQNNRL